ncbi:HAD family phosphatase [Streptomyces sp. NBC_00481]|uniref:HAD family hydrolase n=1 Tax=Streptomyces sp. NBC_00481 TaxID=2975755 RepID=UPI002DD8A555|nr:HAD family phosphatase [Streptomyces sp. NBC_00481]WRZ00610.1 HAD family phosphatase [Streptomyces sp. NBC_00481]
MSTIRGTTVIFDLDGTLVDSEPNYYEASLRTLGEHGVTGFTWADHERYVGISMRETVSDWQDRYGLAAPVEAIVTTKNRHYLELAREGTRVYPEMRKFVERLAAEAVPMAVASGSSREAIEVILGATGLDASVRTVVSAEEVDRGKPAPDVFQEAARRLGAAPADCVVLEDAAPGAVAAHAAGMRCVAVPYLTDQADDPAFATAGLLVRGGQKEFTAQEAYDWIAASA